MKSKKSDLRQSIRSGDRHAYAPPLLRVFGSVGALTQGGGTMMSEGAKATNPGFMA